MFLHVGKTLWELFEEKCVARRLQCMNCKLVHNTEYSYITSGKPRFLGTRSMRELISKIIGILRRVENTRTTLQRYYAKNKKHSQHMQTTAKQNWPVPCAAWKIQRLHQECETNQIVP